MGKKGKKITKYVANPFYAAQESLARRGGEKVGEKVEDVTGVTAAKRAAAAQEAALMRQQQQEKLKLAESEDEIKRRKYLARSAGRRSLISGLTGKGTSSQLGD